MLSVSSLVFIFATLAIQGTSRPTATLEVSTKKWRGRHYISKLDMDATLQKAKSFLRLWYHVKVIFPCEVACYFISSDASPIELNNINPKTGKGWLTFKGIASTGPDQTRLFSDGKHPTIKAKDVYRVKFYGITFGRTYVPVTQGKVVKYWGNYVRIKIEPGYPSPNFADPWIGSAIGAMGKYLRRFQYTSSGCIILGKVAEQVRWDEAVEEGNSVFKFKVDWGEEDRRKYSPGTLIGIKAKHSANAYVVITGDNFHFTHVRWTEKSRGTIRKVSNVRIDHCSVDYSPYLKGRKPCLSTNGGGPQIGNELDAPVFNVHVYKYVASGTGDDSVAFFNVHSGSIRNCNIRDSFAAGIYKYNPKGIVDRDNTLTRCGRRVSR